MVEYLKASKSDKEEIIDFINYVFSHDYQPHDFKTLLPKAYSDEVDGLGAEHYIVKEDGRIKAVVANRIVDMDYCGNILKIGFIGSVAVHPYSRGKGYMKKLMNIAAEDAKKMGVHLLCLTGKRQRYGYFGYENAGIAYNFTISSANVRHALADVNADDISYREMTVERPDEIRFAYLLNNTRPCHAVRLEDEFLRIMHSWSQKSYVIYKKDEMIGYSYGKFGELVLKDESDCPAVIKAMLDGDSTSIPAASYEREKIDFLSSICENYSIGHIEKICVLDWKSVLYALLALKAETATLCDGEKTFDIDGECILVSVKSNKINVIDAVPDKNTKVFSHNQAERAFFELDGLLNGGGYGNWFPLPFYVDIADKF